MDRGNGLAQSFTKLLRISRLTFPDDDYRPASFLQGCLGTSIPFDIPRELRFPEVRAGLGSGGQSTIGMTVPEASMDEDRQLATPVDDVWTTRQFLGVQAIAQPERRQCATYGEFRSGVPPSDPAHQLASCGIDG